MNNKILPILFVLFFSINTQLVSSQAPDYDFYYHSIEQQAIIFEDFSGANQEIVESTSADYIFGPGYSPTREWFAYAPSDRYLTNLRIFSAIQERRIDIRSLLNLDEGIFRFITWGNYEDIITFSFIPPLSPTNYVYIFSPETETYQVMESSSDLVYHVEWLADDSGIIVHSGTVIEIFDVSGNKIEQLETVAGTQAPFQCEQALLPHLLPDGKILYVTSHSESIRIHKNLFEYYFSSRLSKVMMDAR